MEGKDDKGASAQDPGGHGSCPESKHSVKGLGASHFQVPMRKNPALS